MKTIMLHENDEMSITLTKNIESQYYTKHINIQHHYIWKLVNEGVLIIKWIPSSEMLANIMTKALSNETFQKHQALLRMIIKWGKRDCILSSNSYWVFAIVLSANHYHISHQTIIKQQPSSICYRALPSSLKTAETIKKQSSRSSHVIAMIEKRLRQIMRSA